MRTTLALVLSVMCAVGLCGMVVAGNLDPTGAPSSGSGMYSLSQIYDYLHSGIKATPVPRFHEPGAAPSSTMKTTKEIYEDIEAKLDLCNVTADNVELGKTFFCTQPGSWGVQTGTAQLVPTPTPTPTITPTITPTATPTSSLYGGLVSYYKLDETSGTTAVDSVGTKNGTIGGSITLGATGIIGTAYNFNGGNIVLTGLTSSAGSYSVSMWLKPSTITATRQFIFDSQTGRLIVAIVADDGSGKIGFSFQSTWKNFGVAAAANVLHHYVWILSAGTGKGTLYIDGAKQSTEPAYTSVNIGGIVRVSGAQDNADWGQYYGIMDELGLWSRALSSSEVSELWNNGSGKALF